MFFCEAMQVVHDERKAGNEAFKALCNLPPFDGIVAEVQELCESSEKHKTIIEGMQALKESAQFKELEEHIAQSPLDKLSDSLKGVTATSLQACKQKNVT